MAHNLYCDSYHIHNMTYQLYYCNYIRVKNVKCVISWGRCSMIGLIVVMSVVVILVLLLFSFPVDGLGWGWGWGCVCPLGLCSPLLLSVLDRLRLV